MSQRYLHNWKQQPQGLEYVDPGEDIQEALNRSRMVVLVSGQHSAPNGLSIRPGQWLCGLGASSELVLGGPISHDTQYSASVNGVISDMAIRGTTGVASAVKLVNVFRYSLMRLYIDGTGGNFTDACIDLQNTGIFNTAAVSIVDCHLQNGEGNGVRCYRASDDAGAGVANLLINGGRVQAMGGYGIDLSAGLASVQALETSIFSVDIEGCRGGIRGGCRTANIRGCHFEQGGVTMPDDAHIAIVGTRRVESLSIEANFFSGSAAYSVNIGDPSPGGSTIARGVRIATNTFASHGTAALRLRHVVGVDINTNRVPSGVLLIPQDTWEHNETCQLQDEFGVVESVRVRFVAADYTATMLDRMIVVTEPGVTVTLPLASELSRDGGQHLTIKSRAGTTTLARQGSDTIDGETTLSLTSAGSLARLVSTASSSDAGADYWDTV